MTGAGSATASEGNFVEMMRQLNAAQETIVNMQKKIDDTGAAGGNLGALSSTHHEKHDRKYHNDRIPRELMPGELERRQGWLPEVGRWTGHLPKWHQP